MTPSQRLIRSAPHYRRITIEPMEPDPTMKAVAETTRDAVAALVVIVFVVGVACLAVGLV